MAERDDLATQRHSAVMLELHELDVRLGGGRGRTPDPRHDGAFPDRIRDRDARRRRILLVVGRRVLGWVGLWSTGMAFWSGVAASIVGTGELLLVRGIRLLEASWSHAVAAMTLVAVAGANWGLRLVDPDSILPHGLALSGLASVMVGFAGWHGGKLVFDHGVGILISPKN